MKKPLFSALYFIALASAGLTIHQAFAERSPAVEPLTEVSLEDNIPKKDNAGFDFHNHEVAVHKTEAKRVPANIVTKTPGPATPYSYIGPMIFLLALPIALWIVVAKKMKTAETPSKVDYYSKTHQFKPYQAETNHDVEEEEQDYPKAS